MKHSVEYREDQDAQIYRAKKGNDKCIGELYSQHYKLALILAKTHSIDADDAQDIYTAKFMKILESYEVGEAVFSAYLKRCLTNAYISFNRRAHRRAISLDAEVEPETSLSNTISSVEVEDESLVNQEALQMGVDINRVFCSDLLEGEAKPELLRIFERYLNLRRHEKAITKPHLLAVRGIVGLPTHQPVLFDDGLGTLLVDDFCYMAERGLKLRLQGVKWKDLAKFLGERQEAITIIKALLKLSIGVATDDD